MTDLFVPKMVFFEPGSLKYPLGQQLYDMFTAMKIQVQFTPSHNRVNLGKNPDPSRSYALAKKTLVVGVRKSKTLMSCRPSADYQLPLTTSCPGMCEYCYLATTLGKRPYLRLYVNVEEILAKAKEYIMARYPKQTVFEGAATSDPVPVEPYSHSLAKAVEFFAQEPNAKFRFVTKFDDLDSLLTLDHRGKSEVRFSINAPSIVKRFEHGTLPLEKRIMAAKKMKAAGYPVGFMIAPIIVFPGWQEHYLTMLNLMRQEFSREEVLSFELVTHRFTARAKSLIKSVFPHTVLEMEEANRRFKYGQFGYGKYIYPQELMQEIKEFFAAKISFLFPNSEILYFV